MPPALRRLATSLLGQPYLVLTVTTLIWAANAVAGRAAVGQVSPMALTTLRWLVVLLALAAVRGGSLLRELPALRPAWPRIAIMGTFGYTAFNAIFYAAAHLTSAVNMGVIQGVTPALVMLFSFMAFGTRIGPLQAAGLGLTLLGVAVLACRGELGVLLGLDFNLGDLGILVASIFYAGYTVALRRRPAVSPLAFFAGMAAAAFVTSLPLVVAEAALGRFQSPTLAGWGLVAFVGVMPSLVGQVLYMRGVELIGPGRAGLFMNLIPVFAAVLGVALLGETFAAYHAAALGLVLGGIWLAERSRA